MINKSEQQKENFHSLDVYTRISVKAHNESKELDSEEREKLEDLILESLTERVTRVSDEILLQMGLEEGVIL